MAGSSAFLQPHSLSNCKGPLIEVRNVAYDVPPTEMRPPRPIPSDDTMDPKMKGGDQDIPIVLIRDIPKMKYHERPLQFVSEPGISQQQYEHMILSGGTNPTEDESLTIKCPDSPDGTGQTFEVKKSTLIRSPAFARFCKSDSFLPGCHTHLTFMTDPAICFKIAIYYLEEGPDRFNKTRLSSFLRTHFKIVDRFILLGRIYCLAMRMELPGLFDMSYSLLEDYECDMSAGYCITMASLIFARGSNFDKRMKEWCMRYIRNFTLHLCQISEWKAIVPTLTKELQQHWAKLVESNRRVIAAIEEEQAGARESETMSLASVEDERRISIRAEDHLQDMKVEEVIQQVLGEQADSDKDWEDVESLLRDDASDPMAHDRKFVSSPLSDDKANSVLGLSPSKKKIDAIVEWHNARLTPKGKEKRTGSPTDEGASVGSPESAKARAVMGINTQAGRVAGHKKRRFSRKVYSLLHT